MRTAVTGFADASFFAAAHAERLGLLHPGARVLEFGCGAGATGALALREGRCAHWTGIDANAPAEALFALSEVLASAAGLRAASFDVIFAPADGDARALAALLAPGGWLYMDGAGSVKALRKAGLIALAASGAGARGMKPRG
jgi:SAM-dependent methyltransferase